MKQPLDGQIAGELLCAQESNSGLQRRCLMNTAVSA
jgi:hypothetical protein